MAQSTLQQPLTCPDCKFQFKVDVQLNNNDYWTKQEQLNFHRDRNCANFDFNMAINYAFFRPIQDKNVFQPTHDLPAEIGNLSFTYTGITESSFLIRPLTQLFILYDAYHKKTAKTMEETKYSDIYQQTVINSKIGLCLMVVRSSDNHAEIETSEYSMIHTFRSHANSLFYNQQDGNNRLEYDFDQLEAMQKSNYRRIQNKIKNGYYLKFKDVDIGELKTLVKTPNSGFKNDSLKLKKLNKNQLKSILNFLYKKNGRFFVNQEPDERDLNKESFFERKEDGGAILERVFSYCNGNWRNDDDIAQRLAAYSSIHNINNDI